MRHPRSTYILHIHMHRYGYIYWGTKMNISHFQVYSNSLTVLNCSTLISNELIVIVLILLIQYQLSLYFIIYFEYLVILEFHMYYGSYKLYYHLFIVCVCMHMCATIYMLSEDKMWELVLSFYYMWVPGIKLKLSGLVANTFTHQVILTAQISESLGGPTFTYIILN